MTVVLVRVLQEIVSPVSHKVFYSRQSRMFIHDQIVHFFRELQPEQSLQGQYGCS